MESHNFFGENQFRNRFSPTCKSRETNFKRNYQSPKDCSSLLIKGSLMNDDALTGTPSESVVAKLSEPDELKALEKREHQKELDKYRKRRTARFKELGCLPEHEHAGRIENKRPLIANKILQDRARGVPRTVVAKRNGVSVDVIKNLETRMASKFRKYKAVMGGTLMHLAQAAAEETEKKLTDDGTSALDAAKIMQISIKEERRLNGTKENTTEEASKLQMVQAQAITAGIQAKTIEILMKSGAFNPKPKAEPIDVTPVAPVKNE